MSEPRAFKPFLPDGPPYPKRSKGMIYALFAGGAVLLLAIIAAGIWAFAGGESGPEEAKSDSALAAAGLDSLTAQPSGGASSTELSGGLSSSATQSFAAAVAQNGVSSNSPSAPATARSSSSGSRLSSSKSRGLQVANASYSSLTPRGSSASQSSSFVSTAALNSIEKSKSPSFSSLSSSSASSPAGASQASSELSRPALKQLGPDEDSPAVHQVAVSEPLVALTFDDGPSSLHTRKMMDYLESHGVKGTFFFIGKQVKSCPDIVAEASRRGFEVANHTFNHKNLRNLDLKSVTSEIDQTAGAFTAAGLDKPALIRFPYGNSNKKIRRYCHNQGLYIIDWSIDTRDWERKTTGAQVYQKIEKELCPGAIILMHEHSKSTWEALPRVLELLKSKNYQTVTVSELLAHSQSR